MSRNSIHAFQIGCLDHDRAVSIVVAAGQLHQEGNGSLGNQDLFVHGFLHMAFIAQWCGRSNPISLFIEKKDFNPDAGAGKGVGFQWAGRESAAP